MSTRAVPTHRQPDHLDGDPLLIVDGTCGFCARAARFVARRDQGRRIRVLTRAVAETNGVFDGAPEWRAVDSVLWSEGTDAAPRFLSHWAAVFAIGEQLGGVWRPLVQLIDVLVPTWILDRAYAIVAARRHWLGATTACTLDRSPLSSHPSPPIFHRMDAQRRTR